MAAAHTKIGCVMRTATPLVLLLLAMASAMSGGAQAASPPIACAKARGEVERTICGSPELVALDREIAALYDRGAAEFTPDDRHRLAQSQLGFLKRRTGCTWAAHHSAHPGVAVEECVRAAMDARLHALRLVVDRGRL